MIDSLGAGGAERQLLYIITHLDRERFKPLVLTLYNAESIPYHYKDELAALEVPIYSLNLPLSGGVGRFLTGVRRYIPFARRHKPDIVQGCLHFSNLITRAGRPFLPRHRLLTMAQQASYPPSRLRSERLTAHLNDKIVANSQYTYRLLTESGKVPVDKVKVVNCGVEYEKFLDNTRPELRREILPDATFVAAIIARIAPNKDHGTLIEALHLLKVQQRLPEGFRLLIVGAVTHEPTQQAIDAAIAQYDLAPYILQIPATHDIAPYFHAADIKVLPSTAESFGLVVVEAFAAQKPVLASDAANVLGIVRDGETGWTFSTGDAAALADKLHQAIHTPPEQLQQMGAAGHRLVPDYDVKTMTDQYMALYE